jgi:hypothetical protein
MKNGGLTFRKFHPGEITALFVSHDCGDWMESKVSAVNQARA